MRLRKRAAGLALGAGILFLLGTNVQAGWLFVLCALMLGTLRVGSDPAGAHAPRDRDRAPRAG